jgi:glycosyltransferase involved in cell wall biosynthesis
MNELVSVIIPTHNRSSLLERAIQSVLAQTYPDIEIIIVDDGSTDDTYQVVSPYLRLPKTKIRYPVRYIYQPNKGAAAARNAAVEAARGQYLAYLDDDDLFLPEKVSAQVDKFHKNAQLGMVATAAYLVDENEKTLGVQLPARTSFENQTWKLLYYCSYINSSVMVKAICHQTVGVFRDRDLEDYDMWLRIARRFPIGAIQKPLVKYRRHSSQLTSPENFKRVLSATQHIVLDFLYELPLKESFPKVNSKTSEHLIKGAFLCRHGMFNQAKAEFQAAISAISKPEWNQNQQDQRQYAIEACLSRIWLGLIELYNQNYAQAAKQFELVTQAKSKRNVIKVKKIAANGLTLLRKMKRALASAKRESMPALTPNNPKIENLRKAVSMLQLELMHYTLQRSTRPRSLSQ